MQYRARISRLTGIVLGSLEQKSNPQEDAHGGNKWLCQAVMETRFGVRLTRAMLNSGQMKNMLCFVTHSMDKCVCTRDHILLPRQLGPQA